MNTITVVASFGCFVVPYGRSRPRPGVQWRPGRRVLGIEVRASVFVLVVAVNHSDNPHNKAWFLEGVSLVANNTDTNDKDYTG